MTQASDSARSCDCDMLACKLRSRLKPEARREEDAATTTHVPWYTKCME
jgi:hypothetical protein